MGDFNIISKHSKTHLFGEFPPAALQLHIPMKLLEDTEEIKLVPFFFYILKYTIRHIYSYK